MSASREGERLRVRIAQREEAATDIVALELVPAEGDELPPFEAGAHLDVEVAPGLVRQYSLCNPPGERHRYRLGVLRDPASRGGSLAVHRDLMAGRLLEVGLPRNQFALVADDRPVVLAAGGIGITPLLAMAHALHARGTPFTLHYCVRSRDRAAFVTEIERSGFGGALRLHLDDGPDSQRLSLDDLFADREAHVYCCGPEGFIAHVCAGAAARHWPSDRMHIEHFKADVDQAGGAFTVEARRSGVTVLVPEGRSAAQVLTEAGVAVPLSCEQGICGTCLVAVIEGVPDHRDEYQTDEEKAANTHMTPCCSRARSARLVLDL
jgi:vanillate O-demethylase ferredoxin subunit